MSSIPTPEFIDRLANSQLLDDKKVAKIRDRVGDTIPVNKLANQLIEKRWITRWQARQILKNRGSFRVGRFVLLNCVEKHQRATVFKALDTESNQTVRLDIYIGREGRDHPSPRRVLAQFRRASRFEHTGVTRLLELYETSNVTAIVSEWASAPTRYNGETSDSGDPPFAKLKGDKKKVAALVRNLAVISAHAHEQSLYDHLLTPYQIVNGEEGQPRWQLFGVPAVRSKDTEWDKLDPYDESEDEHLDGAAVAVSHDIKRLGRIGNALLTGSPTYDPEAKPESRIEIVFRSMIESSPGRGILSMNEVVKIINRWERANREPGSEETDAGGQVLSEIDEAARAMAALAETQPDAPVEDSSQFELGPKTKRPVDEDEQGEVSPKSTLFTPGIILTIAGVIAVLIIIATSFTVVSLLNRDPTQVANNDSAENADVDDSDDEGADQGNDENEDDSDAAQEDDDEGLLGGHENRLDEQNVNNFDPNAANVAQNLNANPGPANNEQKNQANVDEAADNQNPDAAGNNNANDEVANANDPTPVPEMNAGDGVEAAGPDEANPQANDPQVGDAGDVAAADDVPNTDPTDEAETTTPAVRPASFAELPRIVTLPPLGNTEEPAAGYQNELTIGTTHLLPDELLFVDLLGGDKAFRGKSKFGLHVLDEKPTTFRAEVRLTDNLDDIAGGDLVALFAIRDGQLRFQWVDGAPAFAAAPYLQNCLLVLRTGTDTCPVALRSPVKIESLEIKAGAAKGKTELELDYLPRPDVVRVKALPMADDFPAFQYRDNANTVPAANGSIFFDFAANRNVAMFARIDSSLRNRLTLNFSTFVLNGRRPEPYKGALLEQRLGEVQAVRLQRERELAQFGQLNNEQKKQLPGVEQNLRASIEAAKTEFARLGAINNFVSSFAEKKVPFRVFIQLDEFSIDLATPDGKPIPIDQQGF